MTLLPCPFCGGEVKLTHKLGDYGYTPNMASIRCETCRIGFGEVTEKWKQHKGHYSVKEQAEKILTEKWNKRFDFPTT